MTGIDVAPVRSRRDLRDFVDLPYRLHHRDPCWTPPLRRDVRTLLSVRENPFFEHAEAEHFLARCRGEVVGRVSAIHNRLHNEFQKEDAAFFGFFECLDEQEVARGLLDTAADWARARGLKVLRGPASLSTNDEAGLLVDGFATPSTLMMPHNPPFYARILEDEGFRKAKDLLVYQTTHGRLPSRLVEGVALLEKRYGLKVRRLDLKRFEQEVELVKSLYNAAWERNWGFVPMTDREIEFVARQLKPIVVPELVVFVEWRSRPIGFAIALPDLNVALRKNPSGRFFPGILKVLWAARRIDRLRVILLGTLPDWRGKGVDALLYKSIWEAGYAKGYRWAEAGWVLEENHPMRNGLVHMGFEVYKTYRLYDRDL